MVNRSLGQDPFDLERFVAAQQGAYERACAELRGGKKTGHWIWFIFPQILGLGMSEMSRQYAIRSLDEAKAYLAHQVLGPRLKQVSRIVLEIDGLTVEEIFGWPDDMKLRSSMTLFAAAAADGEAFTAVLKKYFNSERDQRTLDLLKKPR